MFKNIDVMVTHPLVDSNLRAASEKSLAAANTGVNMKKKHYEEWSKYQREHRTGQEFVPFVLETLGGMHPLAKKLLRKISDYAAQNYPPLAELIFLGYMRAISMSVQMGFAEMIIDACLTHKCQWF